MGNLILYFQALIPKIQNFITQKMKLFQYVKPLLLKISQNIWKFYLIRIKSLKLKLVELQQKLKLLDTKNRLLLKYTISLKFI